MTKTAYIYVPGPSSRNLDIGLNKGLWGWRSTTLDKATGRADVQSLQPNDFLVLAHIGPQPRVPAGGWDTAILKRVIVTRITTPYFQDRTNVWPDDVYPERLGIDVLDEEANVTGKTLGSEAAEALRMSANKQGSALVIPGTAALAQFATELPADTTENEMSEAAPQTINHNGADSVLIQVFARREQAKLRKNMLGGASEKACALCGRTLPARFIRAAHIKRRSAASREERLQMANIMPACLLGCDELFEHGYVYVTSGGTIRAIGRADSTADLAQAVKALDGLTVADYTPQRESYFAWHRDNVAG
ncbi:hypothetical protein ACWCO9_18245 [Streptomyces sp. NPDC001937]